ncbi:MAG: radical SAM protein [Myxococcota bacterium]
MPITRLSIEPSRRCAKACAFCYSHSTPRGEDGYTPGELVEFVQDAARNGVEAVSFGGGEPLEYPGLFEVLDRLRGVLGRTFTTNGLLLDERFDEVVAAVPDKVHVSIHFPEVGDEVARVARQVAALTKAGVPAGVNLLVDARKLKAAREACAFLETQGTGPHRMVFLPRRDRHTPTPRELAQVAGTGRFQSMTCLLECGRSPRFASVAADRTVAWCSYTTERRPLAALTYKAMTDALSGLGVTFCGESP